ncbi:MAG: hypothetical protein LPK00_11575 [Bacillaceae bacterium]|nr:hypothetical protein [Bacillaceae bacterium]
MDLVTFLLLGVLVLLILTCVKGMGKHGGSSTCCSPKKNITANPVNNEELVSESIELQKMHSQIEKIEKDNQKLLKEMDGLRKEL